MEKRFEDLTLGVSTIYKSIQKVKKLRMNSLGLKGTHVMCLYYLSHSEDGMTAKDLCDICQEDKAGISRILTELESLGYIQYKNKDIDKKKYRTKAILTKKGMDSSDKVNEFVSHATNYVAEGINADDRETFYKVLFQIADNLKKSSEELTEYYSGKDL